MSERRLCTVANLPKQYPDADLTQAGIRWLIFKKEENGLDICISRIGRKILFDLDKFEAWMEFGDKFMVCDECHAYVGSESIDKYLTHKVCGEPCESPRGRGL